MKRSAVQAVVMLMLVISFFTVAISLQHRGVENVRTNPPFVETWQLSSRSGEMLRLMSLQYDMVMADFLWLRAIQSFGGRGMTNRDWRPMYNLFDTITELDPYFEDAYTFGNLVIGDEGGRQIEGLELLKKGTFKIYRRYRIPFEAMYVSNWQINRKDLARWYGNISARRPDAPDWVPRMTAYIEVEAGAYYIGYDKFITNLLTGIEADDVTLQQIAIAKLTETVDRWNMSLLLQAFDEYTSTTGKLPGKIEDLASMPALQNYETGKISRLLVVVGRYIDKLGKSPIKEFALEKAVKPTPADMNAPLELSPKADSAKTLTELQNIIFQQSLVKQSGIPENPYGQSYELNRMVIGAPDYEKEDWINSVSDVEESLLAVLLEARNYIEERKKDLGRNPKDLREVFMTDFNTTEPFGGQWIYNPETAEFKSSSRPNF